MIAVTFVGYPLFLMVTSKLFRRPVKRLDFQPSVTLIIAAYNEEKIIREKLENCLKLDYPSDLLEIIVASDCSSDGTDDIVREYADRGIILNRLKYRGGKTANQNAAVRKSKGEMIVFSDASAIYEPDAISKLVRNFGDPEIGCVGGRLVHYNEKSKHLVKEKNKYTSFEQKLKIMESSIYSIIGVNGPIYAVRRELARELPTDLTSDFMAPLDVILQGYRAVYEPEAISYEEVPATHSSEFRRKIRTVKAGITVVTALHSILNPFKFFWPSLFLIGHKVLRWIISLFFIGLLFSNFILYGTSTFYTLAMWGQVIFYGLAAMGEIIKKNKSLNILALPYFFSIYILASLFGLIKYFASEKTEIWEVER